MLRDAILEIAQAMENELDVWPADVRIMMIGYIRSLRLVVKSVEGETVTIRSVDPMQHHKEMIERARMEFHKPTHDTPEMRAVEIVDGPEAGMTVLSFGTLGQIMSVGGSSYRVESDGKLHLFNSSSNPLVDD